MCSRFASAANCSYADTDCWFRHCQTAQVTESAKVNCNLCYIEFNCLTDLFRHRKQKHSHQVSKCKHENHGKCKFGSRYCWFIHERHGNDLQSEESDEGVKEKSKKK